MWSEVRTQGLDEAMLGVLAAEDAWPSESISDVLAEAYALRHTPVDEQRDRQRWAARTPARLAPVLSLKPNRRRAIEEQRAA